MKWMEIPQDVETMRSFLRLTNYLNWFSPCLAELSNPLREICRKKMEFKVNKACEVALQHYKEEISKNIMLPNYNPKASMILHTDASKEDLELCYYRTPHQWCLHLEHWVEVRGTIRIWRESVYPQYGEWKSSTTFSIARNLHWRQIRSH